MQALTTSKFQPRRTPTLLERLPDVLFSSVLYSHARPHIHVCFQLVMSGLMNRTGNCVCFYHWLAPMVFCSAMQLL